MMLSAIQPLIFQATTMGWRYNVLSDVYAYIRFCLSMFCCHVPLQYHANAAQCLAQSKALQRGTLSYSPVLSLNLQRRGKSAIRQL